MNEKITLRELQAHQAEPAYQFLMRTINDLWENYIYETRELNDPNVDQVDTRDVGYFCEWCYKQGFFAINHCLSESGSTLQEIIKFCINPIKD